MSSLAPPPTTSRTSKSFDHNDLKNLLDSVEALIAPSPLSNSTSFLNGNPPKSATTSLVSPTGTPIPKAFTPMPLALSRTSSGGTTSPSFPTIPISSVRDTTAMISPRVSGIVSPRSGSPRSASPRPDSPNSLSPPLDFVETDKMLSEVDKLDNKDSEIRQSQIETKAAMDNLRSVTNEIETLQSKLKTTTKETEETRQLVSKKERDLRDKLEKEKLQHDMEIEILKRKIEDLKRAGKSESVEHKNLRKQLEHEEAENQRILLCRQEIQAELATLRQRLDAEAKLKADLERQAKEKETERIRLNKHHQEKEQLSAALDKEQQYKRQLDSMKETKITLSNTKNEVEKDVTHITFEITEESKNQRTLQKTVTKSEKEIARERENLEHQITATIAGYKELRKVEKTHHDALMARELQLNEKGFQDKLRQQVQAEVEDMRQQVETDARVLASTEKDIRELEAKRDELDLAIESQQEETVDTLQAIDDKRKENIASENRKHDRVKAKINRATGEIETDVKEAAETLTVIKEAKDQMVTENVKISARNSALDSLALLETDEARQISKEIKNLDQELLKAEKLIEDTKKAVQSTERSVKRSEKKHGHHKRAADASRKTKKDLEQTAETMQAEVELAKDKLSQNEAARIGMMRETSMLRGRARDVADELDSDRLAQEQEIVSTAQSLKVETKRVVLKTALDDKKDRVELQTKMEDITATEKDMVALKAEKDKAHLVAELKIQETKELEITAMLAAKGKSHLAEELSKKEEDLEVLKAETERKAKIAKMAEDKSKALEKKVAQQKLQAEKDYVPQANASGEKIEQVEKQIYQAKIENDNVSREARRVIAQAEAERAEALANRSDSDDEATALTEQAQREAAQIKAAALKAKAKERRKQLELESELDQRRREVMELEAQQLRKKPQ